MSLNNIPGKLRFTTQGLVYGDTSSNNTTLEEGWLAIDTESDVINIHDGITPGGVSKVQTIPKGSQGLTYTETSIKSGLPIVSPVLGYRTLSNFWRNLWDPAFQVAPNIVTGSYINGSGVITALGGYNVSSHIPVIAGEVLAWWNDQLEDMAEKGAFYNAAGVFLSTIGANALYGGNKILIRVPANASTIRTNFRLTTHRYWLGSRRSVINNNLFESLTFEGDSLFAGSGTYYDKTVPQRIGELFNVPIENHAVGGRRVSGSTAAALWSQIKSTDHLTSAGVFMAGYNDWANNVVLGAVDSAVNTEFNGALNLTLDYLAKGRPWQKWYIVTPPPSTTTSPNGLGLTLRDYCQAIIDACLRKGFTCIDLNRDWGIDYRNQWMGMLYSSDGIHENWLSTDLMAGYLHNRLSCV